MPARVADTSVLAAVLFQEPEALQALALIDGADLYEPTLLAYELASVARKKARRSPEQRGEIFDALRLGLSMDIQWVEVSHLEALRLALDLNLTTYDASYAQVARALRVPLVTFDQRLRAATAAQETDGGTPL